MEGQSTLCYNFYATRGLFARFTKQTDAICRRDTRIFFYRHPRYADRRSIDRIFAPYRKKKEKKKEINERAVTRSYAPQHTQQRTTFTLQNDWMLIKHSRTIVRVARDRLRVYGGCIAITLVFYSSLAHSRADASRTRSGLSAGRRVW